MGLAPYLPDAPDGIAADATVVTGGRAAARAAAGEAATLQHVRLAWRGITIDAHDGVRLDVAYDADVPAGRVAPYVSGPGMAALLVQRGYFVLHASAVQVDGATVAIAADSGVGKSTLAVLLAACGMPYLADDLLVIDMTTPVPMLVIGPPHAKIADVGLAPGWDALGREAIEGRWVMRPSVHAFDDGDRVPLGRLCVLEDAPVGQGVTLERLSGARAVVAVTGADFGAPLLPPASRVAQLRRARQLAAAIPIVRLRRPRRLDVANEVVDALRAAAGFDARRLV